MPSRREGVFPRFSIRDDVERELDVHVALRAEELVREGWDPAEATVEARRLLGDRTDIASECVEIVSSHQRAERRARIVDGIVQDVKYGARTLMRSPGFAVVAVITLALGIGANTAIFSVVHGVLISPLPYEEPAELVQVWETNTRGRPMHVAWPNFVDWKREVTAFERLFAYNTWRTTVLGGDAPVTAQIAPVTADVWSALNAVPIAGRLTTPSDHVFGAAPVVVVSRSFWQSVLAGRPLDDLSLEVNGLQARVVGVVGGLDFPAGAEVWYPVEPMEQSESRSSHNWRVVGRLAEGVSLERAHVEVEELTKRLVANTGDDPDYLAIGATLIPLQEEIVGEARTPLVLLLGAAGLVLLVACTNLASTLLARGTNRARELGVRASLGAAHGRIVRQLVTESVVLAAAGTLAGLGLGALLIRTLERLGPDSVPRLDEVGVDVSVLLFACAVAVGTVLLFGLFPAIRLSRGAMADTLRSGSRGNAQGARGRIWTALVGSEVALALILLVGSGLLIRSFQSLLAENKGFDAADVVNAPVALSRVSYQTPEAHVRWYTQTLAELASQPGVSGTGLLSASPLGGCCPTGRLELDGNLEKHADAGYVVASGGAFEALDIPLLQGRVFDERDAADRPHVAIVSESFAEQYWPGESAIGHTVTGGGMDSFWEERRFAEVVGVVGDVRFEALGEEPIPIVYFPYTQRPSRIQSAATLLVESATGDPGVVVAGMRETIQRLEPDVPIRIATQESLIGDSLAAREFTMLLLTGFSFVALLLAVVGIYGVVSYSVARRTREMGIRLALGADPGGVLRLVMGSSMRMVVAGLILGLIGSVFAGRLMRGLLYGIEPMDPLAIAAGVLVLGGAAASASWLPARQGTRVDPIVTMRAE